MKMPTEKLAVLFLVAVFSNACLKIAPGQQQTETNEKRAAFTTEKSQAIPTPLAKTQIATWERLETVGRPTSRHEAAFVAFKDKIYLIGGRRINPVDVFNPKTREWTEKSESPIELHHFQAVVHRDLIYLIGAMTGPFPNEKPVERVVAYNPKDDKFEFLHPIPVDRRRGAAGATLHNDKIYIVGGITNGHIGGFKPWLDEYDPATGKWRILDDAPNARDHFQAATDGKRLYAAGGRTTSQGTGQLFGLTVKPVNVYDFETETWLNQSLTLPTPRAGNMALIHDGKLIVGGGESDQDMAHDEVEAFDIKAKTWSTMPKLAQGRHGSGFAVVGDYVYTASGCEMRGGSKELTSVERLRLSNSDQLKSNK
jgi:N-acetylneuraminic acid mutarotase